MRIKAYRSAWGSWAITWNLSVLALILWHTDGWLSAWGWLWLRAGWCWRWNVWVTWYSEDQDDLMNFDSWEERKNFSLNINWLQICDQNETYVWLLVKAVVESDVVLVELDVVLVELYVLVAGEWSNKLHSLRYIPANNEKEIWFV